MSEYPQRWSVPRGLGLFLSLPCSPAAVSIAIPGEQVPETWPRSVIPRNDKMLKFLCTVGIVYFSPKHKNHKHKNYFKNTYKNLALHELCVTLGSLKKAV